MENETKNYLEMVDKISETLGSKNDEEIENALVDLAEIKEYIATVKETEENYVNNETKLNETIINLRKSNNKLMRQIGTKNEEKEKENEEIKRIDILDNLF